MSLKQAFSKKSLDFIFFFTKLGREKVSNKEKGYYFYSSIN